MDAAALESRIMDALAGIADPCMAAAALPMSIVELGLIESVKVGDEDIFVGVMFTEVGCPFTHRVMNAIVSVIEGLAPGHQIVVRPIWREPWTESRLYPEARAKFAAARRALSIPLNATSP
jgi:metal-sulfur cluster biosynthetic enzyme